MLNIDQQQTFLQHLCDLPLEEGKAYLRGHQIAKSDYTRVGEQIKSEALRQWHINISVSFKLGELLIFFGEYKEHAPSRALGFLAKGDALRMLGQYQSAKECLDIAGEAFLHLGDEVSWARTRMGWVGAAMGLGYFDEALQEAEATRHAFMKHDEQYWVCAIDHNIAAIYRRQGRYHEACAIYQHIRSVFPSLLDQDEAVIQRSIAMAEANEALLDYLLGEFENAYQLLTQARETFETLHEVGAVIKVDVHLAELDYIQGYYGSALSRYYQTLDSMLAHNLINGPMSLAELKLRLVDCLIKLDRAEEACVLAEEAVHMYRNIGLSLDTGDALREYATALMAFGRPKEALHTLDEAEELFTQGGFDHYASTIKMQRAELQLILGSPQSAYSEAALVKEFSETQGFIEHSIRASLVMSSALHMIASCSQLTQEEQSLSLQEAMHLCEKATREARRFNLQEHVYKGQHLLGKIALLRGDVRKATRCYRVAIAQIERILDNLTHDLSPAFLKTAWSVYEDMIAVLLQQGQVADAFAYLEQARSIVLRQYLTKQNTLHNEVRQQEASLVSQEKRMTVLHVQKELEEWQQEYRKYSQQLASYTNEMTFINKDTIQVALKHCEAKISELFERVHLYELENRTPFSPRKTSKKPNRQARIEQICQQLTPSQLVLSYFVSREKFVVFLITSAGLSYHELPLERATLERLLTLLPAHLEPQGWSDSQHPPQQAILRLLQKLYSILLKPIEDIVQRYKHIIVVPYGVLHNVPFHALHNGTHFLIEQVQISYLPTSSIISSLAHSESQYTSKGGTDTQLSLPLVFGYSGNGMLQRAVEEAKTLATVIHGRCYLEHEATIERLLREARGSSLIHLATHGRGRLDAPNFSSVLLADGQLNALDVFSLDLKGCELVTLSGCETGLSLSGGGDEQIGLGRAFLAAGASSLVMSSWPVEDTATNILMQFFYRNLLAGESKVQALQNAQRALMRLMPHYAHPYFWAAFRLVGNVDPLHDLHF